MANHCDGILVRSIPRDGAEREDMWGYQPPEGFPGTARRLFQELVQLGRSLGDNDQNNC